MTLGHYKVDVFGQKIIEVTGINNNEKLFVPVKQISEIHDNCTIDDISFTIMYIKDNFFTSISIKESKAEINALIADVKTTPNMYSEKDIRVILERLNIGCGDAVHEEICLIKKELFGDEE